jgi:hypothetical protein
MIQESIMCGSNLQVKFDNFYHSDETLLFSFKLSSTGSPIMGSSLFSQSISFMKKADAPKRLVRASKPPAASKTVGGKKTADNGFKHSHATSSSKPSWWVVLICKSKRFPFLFSSHSLYIIYVSKPISKCHTSMS